MEMINEGHICYLCSLVEFLGRATKNQRDQVVKTLGTESLRKVYDSQYPCFWDPFERTVEEVLSDIEFPVGIFDNVKDCQSRVPSVELIGKYYTEIVSLVLEAYPERAVEEVVYSLFLSPVGQWMQDFDSAWYFSNPEEIFDLFIEQTDADS